MKMKIGAVAAAIALFALMMLSGCPKSNDMLDHSRKPGVIPKAGSAPAGEMTKDAPPAGTAAPAGGASSGSSDKGGDAAGGDDTGG
jgi:hypothetical protein